MSETTVNERADRRNALDAFAAAPSREVVQAPSVQPFASPGDRVFGAQPVAVYRDEPRILQKLAALGAAAGDDWFYRFPVRKKVKDEETGKDKWVNDWIEGPSIKLANDLARIYGNCEVDTRVLDMGSSWVIYARFTDFETGFAMTRPFQQDKGGAKLGGKAEGADARRLDIAFQIGVSKAIRNVVTNALQTFADHAFGAARSSLVDRIGKDIQKWIAEVLVRLKDRSIEAKRVEMVLGRVSADWTAPDIAKIIAMMKAVADGMATIDETFPPLNAPAEKVDDQTGEVTETAAPTTSGVSEVGAAEAGEARTKTGPDNASPANNSSSTQPTAMPSAGTAATDRAAPAADPSKVSAGAAKAAEPKTDAEYRKYAETWIGEAVDVATIEDRWKTEKPMRRAVHISQENFEHLEGLKNQKINEINDADKS